MYYNEDTWYDGKQAEYEMRNGITGYCKNCGIPLRDEEDVVMHQGYQFCWECFESALEGYCEICGEAILSGDGKLVENGYTFCEECMEKAREYCADCGSLIFEGDDCICIEYQGLKGEWHRTCICDDCATRNREKLKKRGWEHVR